MIPISAVTHSFSGLAWRWRGGNMDLGGWHGSLADDLVNQLLISRGVAREDLERHRRPTLRDFMPDPSLFRDMDVAAERLASAVTAREAITVYGDYDVDGATSAALLIRLLRDLGVEARAYIPDRLLEGYGPSGEALVRLAREGSSLIVTVDCGAMAHEALAAAHAEGVDVIVVDHHKCPPDLPITAALVNPNRLDESDEAALHGHLAAVGVAFLLAVATVRTLRARGYFDGRPAPDLMGLLDLVALGTVADVAQLKGLNRALVAQGLKVMAKRENTGLAALIDASRLNRAPTCSDLGFALGPRINAAGRIGDSSLGVRLLTTSDAEEARDIATRLSMLNDERRAIEQAVQEAAEMQVDGQHNRAVNVLAGEGWHPGVIGIVAGRIKEKTGKPTLVIALDADDAGNGKGSGRSIAGVDLGAAIIAARENGLLVAGGGHAMACGPHRRSRHPPPAGRLAGRTAGARCRLGARHAIAAAGPVAQPRRTDPRSRHHARSRRAVWRGMAGAAHRRGAGAAGQVRPGWHRSRPHGGKRGRWPVVQGHRFSRCRQRAGTDAASRHQGPSTLARRTRPD